MKSVESDFRSIGTVIAATALLLMLGMEMSAKAEMKAEDNVTENAVLLRQKWEDERFLERICACDEVMDWAGLAPGLIRITDDCVEGKGALEVPVRVDAGRMLRIEHNFLSAHRDGFRNMMCMGMEEEDFTPHRTIRFHYKTDLKGTELLFRIFDRAGGWLDWTIPDACPAGEWREISLSVPPDPGRMMDLRRTGGLMFELRAGEKPIAGKLYLDNIRLITDTSNGLSANVHPIPECRYDRHVPSLDIPDAFPTSKARLILNMSPLEIALWNCNEEETFRQLEEELSRFKGMTNIEIFINPGTRRKLDEVPEWAERSRPLFVKVAQWCEANGVPFYQNTGPEGLGFLPRETMFAVLDAAPKMCRGFIFGECSVDTNNNTDYLVALMDRLLEVGGGKKCLYFQQSSYWLGVMLHNRDPQKQFIAAIQDPKYRDVFVPMWENLLPCAQGLCMGTTLGFWCGGVTSDWGVSAQSWGYANMNYGGTNEMPGHWWFRMLLEVAAAGGAYLELEPMWAFDGENTEGQIRHSKQWAHNLRWFGAMRSQLDIDIQSGDRMKALRFFDKLAAAGIVRIPTEPQRCASLPNVALQVIAPATPSDNRYKWGMFRRALEENWWHLGDCPNSWEMSVQAPEQDVFRYLCNSSHFYDQTIPETLFGLVSILPPKGKVPNSVRVIKTDGHGIVKDHKWLDPRSSREAVLDAYREAEKQLPFTAKGCYCSVVQASPTTYIVYLIDPEERFPVGVRTELGIRLGGGWKCKDALTQAALPVNDGKVVIEIPSGDCRILLLQK
ncbi:MAG TPA: hypothetical protein PL033_21305 [Candidatus Brocadiia bacterium]|nr:hypothetical protein [Candidatus Brocadiia bacterium]